MNRADAAVGDRVPDSIPVDRSGTRPDTWIPVAIDAALALDANPFAFVLPTTFAASTAFVTPVGYQPSLTVYGPGGHRFADFARVDLTLQLLLTIVTTLAIAYFWGL